MSTENEQPELVPSPLFTEKRQIKRTQRTYPSLHYKSRYISRDKARRKSFAFNELERAVLKSISADQHLPSAIRYTASYYLDHLNGSRSQIKNRCVLTGRARAVNRHFRLSRFAFRSLSSGGQLPGVVSASW
jgi:small subunit ribosomal protein S14